MTTMLKVLFLCTANACRSQMAEGLVNHELSGQVQAWSAGVAPTRVNPRAIRVMQEVGIDISRQRSKAVTDLAGVEFGLVVTLCDGAREQCPIFPGGTPIMHLGFPDPARATGTEEEILTVFRLVRDDMRKKLVSLFEKKLREQAKA